MVDSLQGRSSAAVDTARPLAGPLTRIASRGRPGDRPASRRVPGRWWWWASAVAVVLGAVSLVGSRTPTYDPLSWAIWGRELAHGQLSTAGEGAAFKPLPAFVDAVVATLRGDPSVVWLVVTRAAAVLAVVLAFVLARRLAGVVAGYVAAVALPLAPGFLWLSGAGMAEPLEMAAMLAAVMCWLDGRRRDAVVALVVLSLLRPEAWPLLAVAGLVAAGRSVRRIAGCVLLGVLLLAVWFVPDYVGSGDLFRGSRRAGIPVNGGPGLSDVPGLAVLASVRDMLLTPMVAAAALAALVYAVRAARGRTGTARRVTVVTAVAATWLGMIALMTQLNLTTGVMRYLAPFTTLLAVLAGCGCAVLVRLARGVRRGPAVMAGVALLAFAVAAVVATVHASGRMGDELRAVRSAQTTAGALRDLVTAAGGRDAVNACGPVATGPYQVPLVAWTLHRHLPTVGYVSPRTGTVVFVGSDPVGDDRLVAKRSLVRGPWTLRSTCPAVAGAPAEGAP